MDTRKLIAGAVTALALTAAAPAASEAAMVSRAGDTVIYKAAPGERNQVEHGFKHAFYTEDFQVWFRDFGAPLKAGTGCWREDGKVVCGRNNTPSRIFFHLDDGDDTYRGFQGFAMVHVNAGAGNDNIEPTLAWGSSTAGNNDRYFGGEGIDTVNYWRETKPLSVFLDGVANDGRAGESDLVDQVENITGGRSHDYLVGSDGPNRLRGYKGRDLVEGKGGDDTIDEGTYEDTYGATMPDRLYGGPGADTVTYARRGGPAAVTIGAGANDGTKDEGDDVASTIERVIGTRYDDVLIGTDNNEFLDGGRGNDTINPKGGSDLVYGREGNDVIELRDGFVDKFWTGPTSDRDQFFREGHDIRII